MAQKLEDKDLTRRVPDRSNLPMPLVGTSPDRFLNLIDRLKAKYYGQKDEYLEEAELFRVYRELKGKIDRNDLLSKVALMRALQEPCEQTAIHHLRRQVILVALEEFIDEKTIRGVIRSEHLKPQQNRFTFTFALNCDGERITIKLAEPTCDMLKRIRESETHAYERLDGFLRRLNETERSKIDKGTAQYIDQGSKRYVFRIQYEGKNAVLIIGIEVGYFKESAEKERELYEIARSQELRVLKLPEVFAVIGENISAGIIMTDCTKGGNASLMCTGGDDKLIPQELRAAYDEDMRQLDALFWKRQIDFGFIGRRSIYVQTSHKTGEVAIYALDFQNLV